jgi:hypothetical protein
MASSKRATAARHWHAELRKGMALTVLGPLLLAGAFGGLALAWLW